ncbi:tumor necrosis factor ligand superfamily member 14 [Podarcis muralis]
MEDRVGCPSVFVVDVPQRDVPFVPPVRKTQKKRPYGQLLLGILVLLALAGLAIEAYFLLCFRKELDKATSQGSADATFEKFVQGHKPTVEKPAAHLTLGSSVTVAPNGSLQWEPTNGLAFLQDMNYSGGSLICSKPGHYYIYSKLYLGHSNCPDMQQNSQFVTHSVYKRTSQYPDHMVLLTNSIPYCNWKKSKDWRHNSFLAGMVQLEEKDEVFIKVSQQQLVWVKDDSRSYFGAFMI